MRVLSIQQPWAWLIVHGYKPIENRDWSTNVRGEIGIHAGKTYDEDGERWVRRTFPSIPLPARESLPVGGIVGVADLVKCVTWGEPVDDVCSRWFFGDFGFVLAHARPVPLHPCRGQLGFFAVDYTPPPIAPDVAALERQFTRDVHPLRDARHPRPEDTPP